MESTQACSNFGREKEAIQVHTEDSFRVYFLPIVAAYTEQGKQGMLLLDILLCTSPTLYSN